MRDLGIRVPASRHQATRDAFGYLGTDHTCVADLNNHSAVTSGLSSISEPLGVPRYLHHQWTVQLATAGQPVCSASEAQAGGASMGVSVGIAALLSLCCGQPVRDLHEAHSL